MVYFPKTKFPIEDDLLQILRNVVNLHCKQGNIRHFWKIVHCFKITFFTCQLLYITQIHGDFNKASIFISMLPAPIMAVAKFVVMVTDAKTVHFLLNTVRRDFLDSSVVDEKIQKQIKKEMKFLKLVFISHANGALTLAMSLLIFPVFNMPDGQRRLPFLFWSPLNLNSSPVYEIAFTLAAINVFLTILGNVFFDTLFFYCAEHLCVQFKILNNLVQALTKDVLMEFKDYERFHSKKFQRVVKRRIEICVRQHNVLLKFSDRFLNFTSNTLGLQSLVGFIGLGLAGFLITDKSAGSAKTLWMIFFSGCFSIQNIIFSVFGSYIASESSLIVDAVYQCEWYLLNANSRRNLTFIIMKALKPVQLKASGLINLNNEFLIKMYQKVFSIITLLQSVSSINEK